MHPRLSAARERYLFTDWNVLEAAAATGRALCSTHPGADDLDLAWRRAGALLERGMILKQPGRVAWRVSPDAPVVRASELESIQHIGVLIDRFLGAVTAAIPRSAWLRRRIGFPVWPEEEELLPRALGQPLAFIRVDLLPDEAGDLRLIELQTVSGGLGVTQSLREIYGPHPALPGVASGLEEAFVIAHRRACTAGDREPKRRPLVSVFLDADSMFRHELLVLASAFERVEMTVGPWVRTRSNPFPSLLDGRVPDIVFRFFESAAILPSESSFKRTLVRRVATGEIDIQNPWIDLLDDKRLLAVIHEEPAEGEIGGGLTSDDWRRLRELVPRTVLLTAERGAELRGRPRRDRGVYLKKARSSMSRAVVDGQQINRGRFDAAIDRAVAEGDWVVQDALRGAARPFRWLDQHAGELHDMNGYVRLTPIYTRTAEGSVRLADLCITARPHHSRVHGASDACLVVPVG